jgi:hypothetical protein
MKILFNVQPTFPSKHEIVPDLSEHDYMFKCIHTGCLKIRECRIQNVVGKDPVELEKYLEKKNALPEEDISTFILFNT